MNTVLQNPIEARAYELFSSRWFNLRIQDKEAVFNWLLNKDYEYTVTIPLSSARYYEEELNELFK